MLIGELSRACECPVETIRYYEKIGLLPDARRRRNGYREYGDVHEKFLRFIMRTKRLGFTQEEIRQLTDLARQKKPPCADVFVLLEQQHDQIRQRISDMRQIEKALSSLKKHCRNGTRIDCPVLDQLFS